MERPGNRTAIPPYDGMGTHPSYVYPTNGSMQPGVIWAEVTVIILTIGLSLLLLVIILSRERLRQRVFNQLLVSVAVGSVLFNVLVRPGTIKDEDETYEMSKSYCGVYLMLQRLEWLFMPLAFWILSINRLLALRQPETYSERMTKAARAALIGVPWAFAFMFSVMEIFILSQEVISRYGPYPDDPYFDEMSEFVQINCMAMYTRTMSQVVAILWLLFGCVIPVLALFVTSVVLVIVYFRRRGVKVCDDVGELLVSPGSVVLCLLLNIAAMIIMIGNLIQFIFGYSPFAGFLYIHWAWSAVELLAAILVMGALPDIRRMVGGVCCCCAAPTDEKQSLLGVDKATMTPASEPSSEP